MITKMLENMISSLPKVSAQLVICGLRKLGLQCCGETSGYEGVIVRALNSLLTH